MATTSVLNTGFKGLKCCKPLIILHDIMWYCDVSMTCLWHSDHSADHQDGIRVLQSSVEFQQHLVTSAVARLQQVTQRGHCDGVKGHGTDQLVKYCSAIGR